MLRAPHFIALILLTTLSALGADYRWPTEAWGKPFRGGLEGRIAAGALTLCNDSHGFPTPTPGKDCVPEVVYSWGSEMKAHAVFSALKNRVDWNLPVSDANPEGIALFTALSPISTFYYGDTPVRIKFRPGTHFVPFFTDTSFSGGICRRAKKKRRELTHPVYLVEKPLLSVPGARIFEVVLCNFDSVESISHGEKEHYDETLRDLYRLHKLAETSPASNAVSRYAYIQYRGRLDSYPRALLDINFMGRPFVLVPTTSNQQKPDEIQENRSQIMDGVTVNDSLLGRSLSTFHAAAEDGSSTETLFNPKVEKPANHFAWKNPLWFSR